MRVIKNLKPKEWTLEEARVYLESIVPILEKLEFTGSIVGGVAKNGYSDHDLDILLKSNNPEKVEDMDEVAYMNYMDNIAKELRARYGGWNFTDLVANLPDGHVVDFYFEEE